MSSATKKKLLDPFKAGHCDIAIGFCGHFGTLCDVAYLL
jgi:hypothetical protein